MPLVALDRASVAFGHLPLLDEIAFQVDAGERIAVIGRNGTGKSTLLQILGGDLQLDAGLVLRQPGVRVARLVQDVPLSTDRTVAEVVGDGLGPIPPRNALIDAPGPERAGREILPMSTGVPILPTQSAQITARPQRVAFRPERVFISAAGTTGGASDWIVNDIKIGNRSQFSQSGDVPGDMFAANAIDGFVSFETAQTAMDVVMVVTYVGTNESGVAFYGSIIGTAAV